MDTKDLSPEQIAQARGCEAAEELFELAKANGIELSEEQLDAVSGGSYLATTCDELAWCQGRYIG